MRGRTNATDDIAAHRYSLPVRLLGVKAEGGQAAKEITGERGYFNSRALLDGGYHVVGHMRKHLKMNRGYERG